MHGRESSCGEWESRLHVVEEKYTVEFTKMTDEVSRRANRRCGKVERPRATGPHGFLCRLLSARCVDLASVAVGE
jgi:hypothetical protein